MASKGKSNTLLIHFKCAIFILNKRREQRDKIETREGFREISAHSLDDFRKILTLFKMIVTFVT
jgi:hypothetical protein